MSASADGKKTKYPDPITLLSFVVKEGRYSAVDKVAFIGYILLLAAVALSLIGLLILFLTGTHADDAIDEEASHAYDTYLGMLLLGLPVAYFFTKFTYSRYASVYIAIENRRKKKRQP